MDEEPCIEVIAPAFPDTIPAFLQEWVRQILDPAHRDVLTGVALDARCPRSSLAGGCGRSIAA
ncbi:MAG: hypothetical protein ACRD0Q_11695 [Acidimicrobiales bacterium]